MRIPLIIFLLFQSILTFCQHSSERIEKLKLKLADSDSIILVSYDDVNNSNEISPILDNGKLNLSSVHEKKVIDHKSLNKLLDILSAPFKQAEDAASCFMPHHAIILVRRNVYSSVEICFQCRQIRTSPDVELTNYDLDRNKWRQLKLYFKKAGFKYELE